MPWLESAVAGPGDCRIAFWHRPRYSEGAYGGAPDLNPLWNRLSGHARIVLSGHDHNLQRHRPQRGLTQYVVGAGGRARYMLHRGDPTMVWGRDDVDGALRMVLRPGHALLEFRAPNGRLLDRSSRVLLAADSVPAVDEPVVILCGGRGTRLREHTQTIPKPLVEIGGRPILWHVIRIYADQGFSRFVLCLGHRGDLIEDFIESGRPAGGAHHRVRGHGGGDPHRRPHRARAGPARGRALLRHLRGRRGRHRPRRARSTSTRAMARSPR